MAAKFHDYYEALGVSRDASAEDIQRAFRKLARQYHPDVNKDPQAEQKFKEINEANEVLGDPDKRKRYDALGANWKAGQEFRPPPGSPWAQGPFGGEGAGPGGFHVEFGNGGSGDFSDFFEMLFGGRAGSRGSPFGAGMDAQDFADRVRTHGVGQRSRAARSRAGQTHEAEITIGLADAFHGATRQITLQSVDASGASAARTFEVRIPPGTTEGSVIRLGGQGGTGVQGGPAGDLLLRVHLAPDPNFRVEEGGHDLATTLVLAPWEAALGAKVLVRTLDGEIVLTIPPGSQSGQRLRLRSKGLPKRGSGNGDLYVEIRIAVPKELSPGERAAFEELSRVSKFNPRNGQ